VMYKLNEMVQYLCSSKVLQQHDQTTHHVCDGSTSCCNYITNPCCNYVKCQPVKLCILSMMTPQETNSSGQCVLLESSLNLPTWLACQSLLHHASGRRLRKQVRPKICLSQVVHPNLTTEQSPLLSETA
jgi:hypothetical protein